MDHENEDDDDLLSGCKAIAEYRNESPRRTFYLLERRLLPAWKRGEIWETRKSVIRADERERLAATRRAAPDFDGEAGEKEMAKKRRSMEEKAASAEEVA